MSTYKFESLDGGLALIDKDGNAEWIVVNIVGVPSEQLMQVEVELVAAVDSHLFANNVVDASERRAEMQDWLAENGYYETVGCDFRSETDLIAALREAGALRDRFLGGDYLPLDAQYGVWWISEDEQRSLRQGEFLTCDEAYAWLPDATARLLGQCSEASHRDSILGGSFMILAVRDYDEVVSKVDRIAVAYYASLTAAA